MSFLEYLHKAVEVLPTLARFALCMMLIVIVPRLSRRVRLPEAVGLLLAGILTADLFDNVLRRGTTP